MEGLHRLSHAFQEEIVAAAIDKHVEAQRMKKKDHKVCVSSDLNKTPHPYMIVEKEEIVADVNVEHEEAQRMKKKDHQLLANSDLKKTSQKNDI
ncbi:hypothetical protein Tco_0301966 [Tanacetum coccineum]